VQLIFGGLFKGGGTPKAKVLLVGAVPIVQQAPADVKSRLDEVLTLTTTDDLSGALDKVKSGDEAAAVEQHGNQVIGARIGSPSHWYSARSRRGCSGGTKSDVTR
jgi:ABC-2 type transport system permease protein